MNIKFFKKEKVFKKGGTNFNPQIYWGICLCFLFLAILLSIIFGYFFFQKMNMELTVITGDGNTPKVEVINKSELEKVFNYFSARETKSAEILNSPANLVDPSL